jgi:hypothetical protein
MLWAGALGLARPRVVKRPDDQRHERLAHPQRPRLDIADDNPRCLSLVVIWFGDQEAVFRYVGRPQDRSTFPSRSTPRRAGLAGRSPLSDSVCTRRIEARDYQGRTDRIGVVSAVALHTVMASGPPLRGARVERFFRKAEEVIRGADTLSPQVHPCPANHGAVGALGGAGHVGSE